MLRKLLKSIFVILFIAVAIIGLYVISKIANRPAQTPEAKSFIQNKDYKSSQTSAEAWLKTLYENHQLPSISVAVGVNGHLVWSGAIGYANVNKKILADNNSKYRIGSISKPLTAVALMRMSEKGIINLDAPFNTYVDGFASEQTAYTIKQLLSHQAGIRHYNRNISDNFNTTEYSNSEEAAAIVKTDPPLFTPGTNFNYSTYGYTLLSLAMESAYAIPFENILLKEILSPLGLTNTHLNKAREKNEQDMTLPYWLISDALFEAPEENVSNKYAGAGYVSTPTDLVKFGSALLTSKFITPASKELLWSPVLLKNGTMNPEYYALGFRVGQDELGRFVHHGGTSNGGYAFILIYPQTGIVVALASNITSTKPSFDRLQEAKNLARIFKR